MLIALNQTSVAVPYTFALTDINVYSFEEALYHSFLYLKDSADDIVSSSFIEWVDKTLTLPKLAVRIREIAEIKGFAESRMAFFRIIPYFDVDVLGSIEKQLNEWESVQEWERIQERADKYLHNGEPERALPLYRQALVFSETPGLYNGVGICLMKLGRFNEAYDFIGKAYILMPDNYNILFNFAEAAILSHSFNRAAALIDRLDSSKPETLYLRGTLNSETGDLKTALSYFEKAAALTNDPFYIYILVDSYVTARLYDKAMSALNTLEETKETLIKKAYVSSKSGYLADAVKYIGRAIDKSTDHGLWILLAEYHRLNYNSEKSEQAILKALQNNPNSERALLEFARIKKHQGDVKGYQETLSGILRDWKTSYRNATQE